MWSQVVLKNTSKVLSYVHNEIDGHLNYEKQNEL